jgi:hypothetical protein
MSFLDCDGFRNESQMPANGPAIKGVSVAERVKAGAVSPNRGNVPAPARAERLKIALWAILAKEPACGLERTMARFLASWYKAAGVHEYRGTRLIESRLAITLLLFY